MWNKWNLARVLTVAVLGFITYTSSVKMMRGEFVKGDLGVFYHAANLLRTGQDIYSIPTHPLENGGLFYLYPPLFAVLMVPFTYLDINTAVVLWTILNIVLIGVIVVCSWEIFVGSRFFELPIRSRWIIGFFSVLLCSRFLLHHLDKGQVNLLVLAATVIGICLAERKGWKAAGGTLAGFAAVIKLVTFPMALWYLITLRRRSFAGFIIGIVVGFLAPALIIGPERTFYLTSHWLFGYVLGGRQGADHLGLKFNYSVRAQLLRFFDNVAGFESQGRSYSLMIVHLPDSWILGIQALLAFLTIAAVVYYQYRFRAASKIVQGGTLALVFLAIPLLFPTSQKHYFVFLLPACVYVTALWHYYGLSDGWFRFFLLVSLAMTGFSSHAIIGNTFSDFLAAAGCFLWGTVLLMAAIFRAAFVLHRRSQPSGTDPFIKSQVAPGNPILARP